VSALAQVLELARERGARRVFAQPLRAGTWLHLRGGPERGRRRLPQGFAATLAAELRAEGCSWPVRIHETAFGPAVTITTAPALRARRWRARGLEPEQCSALATRLEEGGVVVVVSKEHGLRRAVAHCVLEELAARGQLVLSVERDPECFLEGVRQCWLPVYHPGGPIAPTVRFLQEATRNAIDCVHVAPELLRWEIVRALQEHVRAGGSLVREVFGPFGPGQVLGVVGGWMEAEWTAGAPLTVLRSHALDRACEACQRWVRRPPGFREFTGFAGDEVLETPGCTACGFTGVQGKVEVHEVLEVRSGLPLDWRDAVHVVVRGPCWREHVRLRLSRGEVTWRAAAAAFADPLGD
jgi:hypothetical protein